MHCKSCNNQLPNGAKFCNKCGSGVDGTEPVVQNPEVENKKAIIKCGNCGYVGLGEKNRNLVASILAWICVCFAPLITILYFVATHKYRCPKCKSTFLGIKNKNGVFTGQRGGATRWVFIILILIVGIAIIGILSSVVLASLNTARQKGADASIISNLASTRLEGFLFEENNQSSSGFCRNPKTLVFLKQASKSASLNQTESNYVCNDTSSAWVASVPLRAGGYWCVDSLGTSKAIDTELVSQVSCSNESSFKPASVRGNVDWTVYTSSKDGFSILFPKTPILDSKSGLIVDNEDPSFTYSWHNYKSDDKGSSFIVFKYIYSGGVLDTTNPEKLLKSYVEGLVNPEDGAKLLSSSLSYVGSYRAIDFLIKIDNENIKGRFVLVNDTPFLIMMNYFPVNYDADVYSKFINSFKII